MCGTLWAGGGGQRAGDVLKVCADIGHRYTAAEMRVLHASELEARESRNQRHFLCDAVVKAADGRGHVGAVPVAPSAVGGEDAVDRLARGALVVLAGLRGGKEKGRRWGSAVCDRCGRVGW